MLLKVEDLREWAKWEKVSVENLIETMEATHDIWLLYLIEQTLDDKFYRSPDFPNERLDRLRTRARIKRYNECVLQIPTMIDYDELRGTFTCVPRNIGDAEALLDDISKKMRQIECRTIWLKTWDAATLANMATIGGGWSSWKAQEMAAQKLKWMRTIAPCLCGDVVGPATKLKI